MKASIKIHCDDINDLWKHLRVLADQVKKESKKRKLNPLEDEFPVGTKLEDSNCYGDHELKIVREK
jgi:hypothetical protein